MTDTIDCVDYAILKCLDLYGGSWKQEVHRWVCENEDEVPTLETKSVQTIGRRIDTCMKKDCWRAVSSHRIR